MDTASSPETVRNDCYWSVAELRDKRARGYELPDERLTILLRFRLTPFDIESLRMRCAAPVSTWPDGEGCWLAIDWRVTGA